MEEKKKIIWEHEDPEHTHYGVVYEHDFGILEVESNGIISEDTFREWYDFLLKRVKMTGQGIKLLSKNNRIHDITPEAKKLIPRVVDKTSPIQKMAIVEENSFLRIILKLYKIPISDNVEVNIFPNTKMALDWLKG